MVHGTFFFDIAQQNVQNAAGTQQFLLATVLPIVLVFAILYLILRRSDPSGTGNKSIDQRKTFLGGIHHPWRRFFARTVDLLTIGMIFVLLLSFLVDSLFPQKLESVVRACSNPITRGMILYLLWLPVEAAFISTLGTTPAKWIFGISVLDVGGNKLSYRTALQRVFQVWVQGEGLGIPFAILFTRIFAYRRLTKTGTTLWDESVGSVVTHKEWGILRTTVSVFVVVVALMILVILNSILNSMGSG